MSFRNAVAAGIGGIALSVLASFSAGAAPISETLNQTLSATPIVISFDGVSGFSFFAATTGYGPGAAVSTIGTGQVTTLFGSVTDFEAASTIDQTGELYTFAGYPAASVIPFSAADDFIGLSLTLNDGVHYGYAEVAGASLVSVGFESVAGATILTGATGAGSGIGVATPEPASIGLLATGLALLSSRRRQRVAA